MAIYKIIKTYRDYVVSEETREFKSLLQAKCNAPEIISNRDSVYIYENGQLVARKVPGYGRVRSARWI